jgi:RIO-like serine/threonine protein kinase
VTPPGQRRWCTSACLRALRSNKLHPDCPNYALHLATTDLTLDSVIDEIEDLLRICHVTLLGGGESATVVGVETESGYHLVAKVFHLDVDQTLPKHEAEIYDYLEELEGTIVPVLIGRLRSVYAGTMRYILLMSCGGNAASRCENIAAETADNIFSAHNILLDYGVWQEDVTTDNFLIDDNGRVKIIDFETAEIFDVDRQSAPDYVRREKEHLRRQCDRVKRDGHTKGWYEPTAVEADATKVEKEEIVEENGGNGSQLSSKAKECSSYTGSGEEIASI